MSTPSRTLPRQLLCAELVHVISSMEVSLTGPLRVSQQTAMDSNSKTCTAGEDPPGSPWDFALLALCVAASIPYIVANIVIFIHRKRPYFSAQGGAALTLVSSASGILWIASTFVTNLHFHRYNDFLLLCPLWSFWLKFTFGFWFWLVCLIVRLFRLQRICKSSLPSGASTLSLTLILWSPSVLFSSIATISDASVQQEVGGWCANCILKTEWKWSTFFILPGIYFTIVIIILYQCKGIKDYMMAMEYSHTSEYSVMAFVIFLLYGVASVTKSYTKVYGRCFLTFCICCVVFADFWVRMGLPVYLCLFKEKSEMDLFEGQLQHLGADSLYKLGSGVTVSSASAQFDSDFVLRAIDSAMIEAKECKEKINQLELRRSTLLSKIKQLEAL